MKSNLKSLRIIKGFELEAQDGRIGKCLDFYFDDTNWTVRYIVADTHKWLPGQQVLITPIVIEKADNRTNTLQVDLTKDEIKESPPITTDLPVSRQYEIMLNKYYRLSPYWSGGFIWGKYPLPQMLKRSQEMEGQLENPEEKTHLRSSNEVLTYRIQATDKEIGHVEDIIVEEDTWTIRYLVIDTSNWLPGSKRVLISPFWIADVNWEHSGVSVNLTAEQIKESPEFIPSEIIDRTFEKTIFDYYGYPYYW